ncbi:hypothetical protein C5S30_01235 [ANME-1 cluster archaeon GoMg4]|nr:hypothetical protein [ANME-1 cluster archaeon GoMg4]
MQIGTSGKTSRFMIRGNPVISVDTKKKETKGWNVGVSRDTAEFAVESIRQWWWYRFYHPNAKELLITVCHYPPGL